MSEIRKSQIWAPHYNMEYTNRSHIMSNHSKTMQHITVSNYWSITKLKVRKVKVKVTLVQALRFCTGCTAYRGSRGIALPFHDHSTRRGWEVSFTHRPLSTPGKDPVTHCTGGWVGRTASLDRWGKSCPPTRIQSPDHPARSQWLYRLSYPVHQT
jgi:hypothetical protein